MMKATHTRVKGETALPVSALVLVDKVGVTRAAKEIGTSTTTLHKARKSNIVSKVVEVAATHVLEHLGDIHTAPPPKPAARSVATPQNTSLFLLEVNSDKAALVEKLAEALGADLIAA